MMKAFSLNVTMNALVMMINHDKDDDEHVEVERWASRWALNGDNDGDDEGVESEPLAIGHVTLYDDDDDGNNNDVDERVELMMALIMVSSDDDSDYCVGTEPSASKVPMYDEEG